uniref:Uncharacterized protein n=1 Tax=Arundo donax TaxID=35708 RepID=A0A0A9H9M4_ARUDO
MPSWHNMRRNMIHEEIFCISFGHDFNCSRAQKDGNYQIFQSFRFFTHCDSADVLKKVTKRQYPYKIMFAI